MHLLPKTIFSLIFIFLISTSPAFSAFDAAAAQEAFHEGLRLKDEGSLDQAQREFAKAVENDPANADYHFELANLLAVQHDAAYSASENLRAAEMLEAASRSLEQAVMVRPDFLAAHFNLGIVYKKQGKYAEAREQFKEVLQMDPNQMSAYMQIAATYEDQGFYDEAQAVYEETREKFASQDVQYALQDLGERREAARMHAQNDMANSSMNNWNQLRQLSQPGYQQTSDQQAQGNPTQAVPYLSSWLMQQFMKSRAPRE